VCLKPGFDRSFEAVAARRAGLPLKEGAFYEVLGCQQGEISVVLSLREVRVVHVGGIQHVTKVSSEIFPYVAERFEPAFKPKSGF